MMDPRTRSALVVTTVAVLAVGISAATLTSTVQSGADSGGSGGGGGIETSPTLPDLDLDLPAGDGGFPPIIVRIVAALMLLAALGVVVYGLVYRNRAAAVVGIISLSLIGMWLIIQLLTALSLPTGALGGWFGGLSGLLGGDGSSGSDLRAVRNLLLVVVVVALAGLAAFLFTGTDRDRTSSKTDTADEPTAADDTTELGRIAGRAAEQIDGQNADEALDNQVYEAYTEMITQLDVPSNDATTPREFAEAAADRGMAAEDVSALTDLFETVRYGGDAATADREQEALDILRRIERRYTDE